ncbi:MAG: phosphatase PAP2 family protein, partial [Endozoicomonas sp. (ex Botrylloides leachii)]|nr:phosphatase PAP2 family protein [Endozoicomonas sp. (ex Botrylloides leachii)]
IIFSNRKVALAATALAILTGLSRIAVGAHWPADIIAGAWVGLICSAFGVIISTRINTGFLIRSFYIFLGFIPALLLPVYHNGFQNITAVQYLQYALALMSLIIILPEVHSLVRDYKSRRDNNT